LNFTFRVREMTIRLSGIDRCGLDLVQGPINELRPTYSSLTKYNPDDFDLRDSVLTQYPQNVHEFPFYSAGMLLEFL
jgi:hypothetical protein